MKFAHHLTVLSGFIETIQTLDLSASEQKQYLALMGVQAERMRVLVDDLLTLSRLEGSPMPSTSTALPLHLLMKTCEQEAKGLSASIVQGEIAQVIAFHPANRIGRGCGVG